MNNPFGTSAPKAPTAAPAAQPQTPPTVPPTVPQAAPVTPTAAPVTPAAGGKVKKVRKTPNKQMTNEQRKFVLQNYATRNTNDIAQELGLTRQQVYRTISESRKNLTKRIESLQQLPDSPEKAEQIQKIQQLLDTLPNKPFGGGHGNGGARKSNTDSVIDDLIASL